jgi:hypothetical protein
VEDKNNSPILVTGSHRSGSTWVGQVLASCQGMGYMHEPLNPIYPTPRKSPINVWYKYINEHNHDVYFDFVEKTLNWNYVPSARFKGINNSFKAKMWLKYNAIFLKNKGSRPIVKDPIALFSTPWLHKQFNASVVLLIRHPAAFAYSLKRKNWEFPFGHLLNQKELISDWLIEFKPEITEYADNKHDIIEQACLVWRIIYSTVGKFQKQFPKWIYLKHEDLSLNPVVEFKKLFERLNIPFDESVEKFVLESSSEQNPSGTVANEEQLQRDSAANIKYWKNKLSADEIEKIKELTKDIWPAFYVEADW